MFYQKKNKRRVDELPTYLCCQINIKYFRANISLEEDFVEFNISPLLWYFFRRRYISSIRLSGLQKIVPLKSQRDCFTIQGSFVFRRTYATPVIVQLEIYFISHQLCVIVRSRFKFEFPIYRKKPSFSLICCENSADAFSGGSFEFEYVLRSVWFIDYLHIKFILCYRKNTNLRIKGGRTFSSG